MSQQPAMPHHSSLRLQRSVIHWLLLATAGVVPAFAIGYAITEAEQTATTPVATAPEVNQSEATPQLRVQFPDLAAGARSEGVWSWSQLRGGECISPFDGGMHARFTVVGCEQPHQARFIRPSVIDDNIDSDYPGEAWLSQAAREHCQPQAVAIDQEFGAFDDLLIMGGYSRGEQAWRGADRLVGCFVFRDGGLFFPVVDTDQAAPSQPVFPAP